MLSLLANIFLLPTELQSFFHKQHFATSLVGKLREDQLELQRSLPGLEAGARLWSCALWSSQEQLFLGWENSFAFA